MNAFESLILILAIMGAVGSVGFTVIEYTLRRRERRKQLEVARSQNLSEVLAASDLRTVGTFLDDTIGRFSVADYVQDKQTAGVVDTYLDKLTAYLGTSEEVEEEARHASTPAPQDGLFETPSPPRSPEFLTELRTILVDQLKPAVDDLRRGETWNAMARMRRGLEIEMRAFLESSGFAVTRGSLSKMTEMIASMVPDIRIDSLKFAISLGNRAVHGEEVSYADALNALLFANETVQRLHEVQRTPP